ncbi:MAG: antibiotic biosynthesis monooxygenase [Chloroflexi bacterium]|nr:antibiotic biosynthesis monooxygenase [Chloroflexota bacterium]
MTAQSGKRSDLVNILKRAAQLVGEMIGCRMYIVSEDVADENAAWVFEMWDDKTSHDESLKDERVRALIGEARPILSGAPEGAELRVAGGFGI